MEPGVDDSLTPMTSRSDEKREGHSSRALYAACHQLSHSCFPTPKHIPAASATLLVQPRMEIYMALRLSLMIRARIQLQLRCWILFSIPPFHLLGKWSRTHPALVQIMSPIIQVQPRRGRFILSAPEQGSCLQRPATSQTKTCLSPLRVQDPSGKDTLSKSNFKNSKKLNFLLLQEEKALIFSMQRIFPWLLC